MKNNWKDIWVIFSTVVPFLPAGAKLMVAFLNFPPNMKHFFPFTFWPPLRTNISVELYFLAKLTNTLDFFVRQLKNEHSISET